MPLRVELTQIVPQLDALEPQNPENSAPSRMIMPVRVEFTQLVPQPDGLGQALWFELSQPKQFHTIPHAHAAPCGIDSTRAATRRLGPGSMAWALETQTIPHHPACSCRSVWN